MGRAGIGLRPEPGTAAAVGRHEIEDVETKVPKIVVGGLPFQVEQGPHGRAIRRYVIILISLLLPDLCICGSEKDINSVVTNLLANAVKHTPAGTTIRIQWQSELDGQACLSVEDNGPGIPEKHLPHLTERFYRVDEGRSRASGGTGLGLAIVKHVMQWHNGKLTIDSKPGCTVFRACFPAKRVLD